MASVKNIELGTVVKKYDSGICETDKGHRVFGNMKRGIK